MKFSKSQFSWLLYDPANAAYALIVRTVFAPAFFMAAATPVWGEVSGTAYWGYTASLAGIAAGVFTLATGNFADVRHRKRRMLGLCTGVGLLTTAAMSLLSDRAHPLAILILFFFGMCGYMSANGFYDSLLIDAAKPEERDRLSSIGYAWGYLGGMVPFIPVMLVAFYRPAWAYRAAFWITALWWGAGTVPLLRNVPETGDGGTRVRMAETLKFIAGHRLILFFLIAYFLYIDGIGTILLVATPLAANLRIPPGVLMTIVLALQVIAFPFTVLYGRAAEKFGARPMIRVAIAVYVLIAVLTAVLSFTPDLRVRQIIFGGIAFLIGTSQGGIQALSRSLYSRIIPPERAAELFSVYNFFGKFTTILGPVLVGAAAAWWARPELGVTLLILPFLCGGILLSLLPLPPGVR
ncbi:MAG: MFS transporter [Lentisphaeria bacterium]|nr:MFS transporter [Lentisphaeria bacterium]